MKFVTFGTYDVWVINNTGNFTFGSFDVFLNFWCLCRKLPMTTGTCVPHPGILVGIVELLYWYSFIKAEL